MELKKILLVLIVIFILLQIFLFWDVISGKNVRMRSYSRINLDFSQELVPEVAEAADGNVKRLYRIDAVWILPFVTKQMAEHSRVMAELYSNAPVSKHNGSWVVMRLNGESVISRNLTWNGTDFTWVHSNPLGIQIPLRNLSRSPPVIEVETSEGVIWDLQKTYILITFFPQDIKTPYWQEHWWARALVWALFVVEAAIGLWCARSFVRWIKEQ